MRKIHDLKILFDYAEMVRLGVKTFELRKNDRDYQVGDLIKFHVDDYFTAPMVDFERTFYEITCVVEYPAALKEGYVCLGIKKLDKANRQKNLFEAKKWPRLLKS